MFFSIFSICPSVVFAYAVGYSIWFFITAFSICISSAPVIFLEFAAFILLVTFDALFWHLWLGNAIPLGQTGGADGEMTKGNGTAVQVRTGKGGIPASYLAK